MSSSIQEEIRLQKLTAGKNNADLNKAIKDATKPVVIFVRAGWCGIAKVAEPVIRKLAGDFKDRATFYENETDADEGAIARRYTYGAKG